MEHRLESGDQLRRRLSSDRFHAALSYVDGSCTVNPMKLALGMKDVVQSQGVDAADGR